MPEVHELKRSLGLTPGEPLGQAFVVREVEVSGCQAMGCGCVGVVDGVGGALIW